MADLAREEADRYFSSRAQPTSHPEDRDHSSDHSSSDNEKHNSHHATSDADTDDDDMATMTTTQTHPTFHLPSTTSYANTGPKGVIADAQSYQRAKQSTFRDRFTSFTNSLRPSEKQQHTRPALSQKASSSSSHSNSDSDSEFMSQWRAARLAELQTTTGTAQRRISPSRRTWGTLAEVDATGYLDAIEKVSAEDVVVVMIFDRSSTQSKEVEDELGMLAYRHNMVRFVKLDSEVAEMREVDVPAVLAYRDGEVFATMSGAKGQGLEAALKKHRVLG